MKSADVFASPQFQKLAEGQRTFLRELTQNGWDKIEAARKAWNCKDDASASAMAERALRNQRVAAIVALIDPAKVRMTKDEALQIAAKHLRTAEKPADVAKLLELLGRWEGWESEPPSPVTPTGEADIYSQVAALEKEREKQYESHQRS